MRSAAHGSFRYKEDPGIGGKANTGICDAELNYMLGSKLERFSAGRSAR